RLRDLGLEVVPSHANFVLFRSPVDLARPLLERGLMIRSCGNFAGLDSTYWRVGLKRRPDNVVLIDALQAVVHG
ncbi:MAG: hypothetical protein LBS56_04785, partial [Propionibacteriaceae bacterium]|nr:hypothetical protein [Propionibacteriaceae bacterium]